MALQADQRFVALSLARKEIAGWINQAIDDDNPLNDDDDRLTDEICQRFATSFGELDMDNGETAYNDAIHFLSCTFATELGLTLDYFGIKD